MDHHWLSLLLASFLEATFGYPRWLYGRIRHPVVWMGAGITVLEKNCNLLGKPFTFRRIMGVLAMTLLIGLTLLLSLAIGRLHIPFLDTLLIASLLAQKSLYTHVKDVEASIFVHDLAAARANVGKIVGRDTSVLDEAGVCRAAIESLAESICDGVVAPLLWAMCFGLPGIACYKMINTADSMIGHKDERFYAFGWAAARLDDLANYLPARLSALLIIAACFFTRGTSAKRAWTMLSDASLHASPNAGWPESAMAGALDLRLGGPQHYDGELSSSAYIGNGTREATGAHIHQALRLYLHMGVMLWLFLAAAAQA